MIIQLICLWTVIGRLYRRITCNLNWIHQDQSIYQIHYEIKYICTHYYHEMYCLWELLNRGMKHTSTKKTTCATFIVKNPFFIFLEVEKLSTNWCHLMPFSPFCFKPRIYDMLLPPIGLFPLILSLNISTIVSLERHVHKDALFWLTNEKHLICSSSKTQCNQTLHVLCSLLKSPQKLPIHF